jgi:hypothetical protein
MSWGLSRFSGRRRAAVVGENGTVPLRITTVIDSPILSGNERLNPASATAITNTMADERTTTGQDTNVLAGGRLAWLRLVLWLPAAVLAGGVAAWAAVLAQSYFAPWLVFPMLVGVGLGGMLVGLLRFAQVGHRPTILSGTLLAVAVAVVGQHYLGYRYALQREQEIAKQLQERAESLNVRGSDLPFRQPIGSFAEFMRQEAANGRTVWWDHVARGWQAWLTWGIDAILILAAALAVVVPAARQPYCNRCQTWYRTVRSGRTSLPTARRLAELSGLEIGLPVRSARYRLSSCHGGCNPTRLELSWEEADGRTFLSVAWLASEQRNQVMQTLDEEGPGSGGQGPDPDSQPPDNPCPP